MTETKPIITEQQNYSIAGCGELKARRRFGRNLAALFANLAYHILISNRLGVGQQLWVDVKLISDAQDHHLIAEVYVGRHGSSDD